MNNGVDVSGWRLDFDGDGYADGTPVRVFAGTYHFFCRSLEDIEHECQKRERRQESSRQQDAEERQRDQDDSLAFNAALNISVVWFPEIKPVLSGLTENSMGNGTNRRTVVHVVLKEAVHDGRLHRELGQPLCSKDLGSFEDLTYWHKEVVIMKVTCKTCLKIAARWKE